MLKEEFTSISTDELNDIAKKITDELNVELEKKGVVYAGEANAIINKYLNTQLDETIKYSGLILEVEDDQ